MYHTGSLKPSTQGFAGASKQQNTREENHMSPKHGLRLAGLTTLAASALAIAAATGAASASPTCTPTGYVRDSINLTAALINPPGAVSGELDATGCNIGVYYNQGEGSVAGADIHGANYYGVIVDGTTNDVTVNIKDSQIHDIGESPLNGTQHGVAVYYTAFSNGTASGTVSNNTIWNYQKGGVVANGEGTSVQVNGNTVVGQGPVDWIAQNGIQIGYGASAKVMRNDVSGNSYTGASTVSGGIIVVGGACYGPYPYTTGVQIVGNTVTNNDVGIWLTNIAADCVSAADSPTNIKVVNNVISSDGLHNSYAGGYQAGIADQGYNDKIINNDISGPGYDPAANPGAYTVEIDADPSFTNFAKVHANS